MVHGDALADIVEDRENALGNAGNRIDGVLDQSLYQLDGRFRRVHDRFGEGLALADLAEFRDRMDFLDPLVERAVARDLEDAEIRIDRPVVHVAVGDDCLTDLEMGPRKPVFRQDLGRSSIAGILEFARPCRPSERQAERAGNQQDSAPADKVSPCDGFDFFGFHGSSSQKALAGPNERGTGINAKYLYFLMRLQQINMMGRDGLFICDRA